jgi:hypothetical protein
MFVARRYTAFANPATDYVSLAEAKQHLRVTSSSDDAYITNLISMAIESCSAYLGYSIRKATARYAFDGFTGAPAMVNPINGLNIPSGNYFRLNSRILAILKVYYLNSSQTLTEFDSNAWIASTDPMGLFSRNVFIESSPTSVTDDLIKYIIEVTEGFEPSGTSNVDPDKLCPASIKHAALLLVGQYYDNRQAITVGVQNSPLNFGFQYLLDAYKISVLS